MTAPVPAGGPPASAAAGGATTPAGAGGATAPAAEGGSTAPVVVTYEDRPAAFAGAELLARSLHRHSPGLRMLLYSPSAELAGRLADLPNLEWIPTEDLVGRGWNVKPAILSRALETHPRALWLDTDIVVAGDLAARLARFAPGTLVVGQEFRVRGEPGGSLRARAHGIVPARTLPHHVNSGSVLVERRHLPVLRLWSELLAGPDYQAWQKKPTITRVMAHVGDQDVLWAALLDAAHAGMPVDYFMNGRDTVLHYGGNGFHVLERIEMLRGATPVLMHMPGLLKPWSFGDRPSALRQPGQYMHMVSYELSPVFEAARPYAAALSDPPWLRRRTLPARLCNALFLGNVALRGMPLALATWGRAAAAKRMRQRRRGQPKAH